MNASRGRRRPPSTGLVADRGLSLKDRLALLQRSTVSSVTAQPSAPPRSPPPLPSATMPPARRLPPRLPSNELEADRVASGPPPPHSARQAPVLHARGASWHAPMQTPRRTSTTPTGWQLRASAERARSQWPRPPSSAPTRSPCASCSQRCAPSTSTGSTPHSQCAGSRWLGERGARPSVVPARRAAPLLPSAIALRTDGNSERHGSHAGSPSAANSGSTTGPSTQHAGCEAETRAHSCTGGTPCHNFEAAPACAATTGHDEKVQAGEITADSLLKVLSFGRAPSTSPAAAPDHSVSGNATAAAAARASKLLLARPTGAAGAPQAAEDSRLRTDGRDGASWARVSSMYRKAWTPALRAVRLLQTRVDRTYDAQAHLAPEWRSSFRSELRQAMMSFDKRRAPHPAMRSPAPSTQLAHTVGVAPLDDTSAAPHHSFTTPLPTPLAPSLPPRAPMGERHTATFTLTATDSCPPPIPPHHHRAHIAAGCRPCTCKPRRAYRPQAGAREAGGACRGDGHARSVCTKLT